MTPPPPPPGRDGAGVRGLTLSAATLRSKRKKGNKVWEGRKEGRPGGKEGRDGDIDESPVVRVTE